GKLSPDQRKTLRESSQWDNTFLSAIDPGLPALSRARECDQQQLKSWQEAYEKHQQLLGPDDADAKADAPPTSHLTARAFGPGAATWGGFIWLAITMGALSLLTPCVFPMVPITVSYFTRHAAPTRGRAFASAA